MVDQEIISYATAAPPINNQNIRDNSMLRTELNQYAEQTKLLLQIVKTEQNEKKYLETVVDYLSKYIYILRFKINKIRKYYTYHTFISITVLAFLIMLYIFEKTRRVKN